MDVGPVDPAVVALILLLEIQRQNASNAQVVACLAEDSRRSVGPLLRAVIEQGKADFPSLPVVRSGGKGHVSGQLERQAGPSSSPASR